MDNKKLAELLLPKIDKTPEYYEELYPKRLIGDAMVTRFAPSPTGFAHIGGLFVGYACERLAHQSNGVFYLRIEDTDDKRYVEGAVDAIINSLLHFDIKFDEGVTKEGQIGGYGDYYQSNRVEIYQCFVKSLIEKGQAYPCFMTTEELEEIREKQESGKLNYGVYGDWAVCRNLSYEEIESRIKNGEEYVIRLKSDGNLELPKEQIKTITVNDGIRGELIMPENNQDVVVLKSNGVPTYHFAHAVDDHLMRTTHVVRGAEWLPSLPIHVELFDKLGFELPIYCHTAQLMKIDETGNKRKLSKRKDPELSLEYYRQIGYHPVAVKEYLMTLLNSNFEEWRLANPDNPIDDFEFTMDKMGSSGALLDLNKLEDVSKNVFLKMKSEDIYEFLLSWAEEFNHKAETTIRDNKAYICKILDIGRIGDKPRKDLISASQIFDFIKYFFDEFFVIPTDRPNKIDNLDAIEILKRYNATYIHHSEQSEWFEKIRKICEDMNYAVRPKDYKKNPDEYKGHIGDVSEIIRFAITARTQSPDLWEIQQIIGNGNVRNRIDNMISILEMNL